MSIDAVAFELVDLSIQTIILGIQVWIVNLLGLTPQGDRI